MQFSDELYAMMSGLLLANIAKYIIRPVAPPDTLPYHVAKNKIKWNIEMLKTTTSDQQYWFNLRNTFSVLCLVCAGNSTPFFPHARPDVCFL
jgi:hypothetical protein